MARRAFLVGIDRYLSPNVPRLHGCLNDVSNIRNILKTHLGFTNREIRVLVDDRATKDQILHRLRWMVHLAGPGDHMVFFYAGHGSRVLDRNGDELSDRMDEIICPYDMNWDDGYIRDDDLDRIFEPLAGRDDLLLEVVFDSCNSGSATRLLSHIALPGADTGHPPVSRYLPPPLDIESRFEGETEILGSPRGFRSVRSTRSHVFWSASREDQLSSEIHIDGRYTGAFTHYFCRHIRETGGNITRSGLLERVRNSLRWNGLSQVPQLEAAHPSHLTGMPLQFDRTMDRGERLLYLTTPYMRGEDVRRLQSALSAEGYQLQIDGVFGPHTHRVVTEFQRRHNLVPDGVAGPEVRGVLFG